jgi:hypothetical protein
MSRTLTAAEAKQEHIQKMGRALGLLYDALWQEVAWLYAGWLEYVELYGAAASRVELLNQAAPRFFRMVQDSLWEGTILSIARLTDPPKSMGKENLTIQALPAVIDDPSTRAAVARLVDQAVAAADFCRDWRNRHIAHRDLALAIQQGARPLQEATRQKVRESLEAIAAVLNSISVYYTDAEVRFDLGVGPEGALALLYVIDDGLKIEATREERMRRGEIHAEDFEPRNL